LTFTCPLANGVHARPASALEEVMRGFSSRITIVNERTGQSANAKSVLGIIGLDIRLDDRCGMTVGGTDEREAAAAVKRFLESDFARCDDALIPAPQTSGKTPLPPLLRLANVEFLRGTSMVPGIGRGRAVSMRALSIPDTLIREKVTDVDLEIARLDKGLHALDAHYQEQLGTGDASIASGVISAHHAIARDPTFREYLITAVRKEMCSAASAIAAADAHFSAMLVASGSLILRERVLDIRDVCGQLYHSVYGSGERGARTCLTSDAVCIADNLTPGEFLSLDRTFLKGLVIAHSATTSHTIVLARSFGIPTLTGVVGLGDRALDGREVVVDADLGVLVTTCTTSVRRYYEMEGARLVGRSARLDQWAGVPAATSDGRGMEIGANIATAAEAALAFAAGADGIGIFRTEMLFMNRDDAPSEDEQFEEYRQALTAASGKPVIIRTLDVGGDKPIAYLLLPQEENPFLGFRAVRMYPEFHALVRTQVRALVRASAFGQLKLMVPMISRLDEALWVKQMIAEEQAGCAGAGVAYDSSMQVGGMVEVPSMAFQLDHFCRELDFFSVGTNDLLQYFLAVDRTSDKIASLYDPMTPAFLRLLKKVVDDIHAAGRWVGVCGELGGQGNALPLLVGLGFDELSMAAPSIAGAKADVRSLDTVSCQAMLAQALACESGSEVERLLEAFDGRQPIPLLSSELVVIDADCATREEAIKTIVDQLYITGRTEHPRDIEAAVWQREAVYSTAFGHGFAIPHCKSDAVKANSLAILRLRRPVAWDSLDGQPVSVVVLLAIRESDQSAVHLKILATLARQVMHEEFRERLEREQNPDTLCGFVRERVGG
jgi:fructose-specific PTS system IIA-like component